MATAASIKRAKCIEGSVDVGSLFNARRLAKILFPVQERKETNQNASAGPDAGKAAPPEQEATDELSVQLADALFEAAQHRVANEEEGHPYAGIVLSAPKYVKEPDRPPQMDALMRRSLPDKFYRWRAKNDSYCLSVRASKYALELYIIPTEEIPFLSFAEYDNRLQVKLELLRTKHGLVWCKDNHRIRTEEILQLLDTCLRQVVSKSAAQQKSPAGKPSEPNTLSSRSKGFEKVDVDRLTLQMQNLAYRLVSQQEELKKQISRELHDSIIADMLMLKRHMSGDKPLSNEEVIETLDEIVEKLRDICNDYSPRNLQDWGLRVSIEGLLERVEERSGIRCTLECNAELPVVPDIVQLHVFRIVQEALNNAEKYSQASEVIVKIDHLENASLAISIKDNGCGFDVAEVPDRRGEGGGMGMTSMQQRAEIIRSLYPTTLSVTSTTGEGSEVKLTLKLK
ncbi:MAG TPA: ATP-binding protein [Candidatus Obscuribacterales bacterium]